jgi:hypothetical protein
METMKPITTTKNLPMLPGHDGIEHKFVNVGDTIDNYAYPYLHTAMLVSGRLEVTCDGISVEYVGPRLMTFEADRVYSLKSLEPDTVTSAAHPTPPVVEKKKKKK